MSFEAYTGGLFDADGSVFISKHSTGGYGLCVAFLMTDRQALDLVSLHFGGKVTNAKGKTAGKRNIYQYRLWGLEAKQFLIRIKPWVFIKASQLDLALVFPLKEEKVISLDDITLREFIYFQMKEFKAA